MIITTEKSDDGYDVDVAHDWLDENEAVAACIAVLDMALEATDDEEMARRIVEALTSLCDTDAWREGEGDREIENQAN